MALAGTGVFRELYEFSCDLSLDIKAGNNRLSGSKICLTIVLTNLLSDSVERFRLYNVSSYTHTHTRTYLH